LVAATAHGDASAPADPAKVARARALDGPLPDWRAICRVVAATCGKSFTCSSEAEAVLTTARFQEARVFSTTCIHVPRGLDIQIHDRRQHLAVLAQDGWYLAQDLAADYWEARRGTIALRSASGGREIEVTRAAEGGCKWTRRVGIGKSGRIILTDEAPLPCSH
jgi:hypothetical protein